MNWIDVKERQPEELQEVAFIVDSDDPNYAGRKMSGRYQGVKGTGERAYYEFTTPGIGWSGTHWMPLPDLQPAPPAQESEGMALYTKEDMKQCWDCAYGHDWDENNGYYTPTFEEFIKEIHD